MGKLEQKIQSEIITYLKSIGIWNFKTVASNKGGIPDIVGCTPEGNFLAVEVKRPGEKQTALQVYNQELIERNGGIYILAKHVADCKNVLELGGNK